MSMLIEKSVTVLEAVYANTTIPLPALPTRVEVIYRTPVEGETIQVTPNGSKRTMLLLSEIDNTTPFTCSLAVDTSRMNVGDQLFVCTQYLLDRDTIPQGARAKILLFDNMIFLMCGLSINSVTNAVNNNPNNFSKKQQNEFIFDGEYLICSYDYV
jgi:hypothetical protein